MRVVEGPSGRVGLVLINGQPLTGETIATFCSQVNEVCDSQNRDLSAIALIAGDSMYIAVPWTSSVRDECLRERIQALARRFYPDDREAMIAKMTKACAPPSNMEIGFNDEGTGGGFGAALGSGEAAPEVKEEERSETLERTLKRLLTTCHFSMLVTDTESSDLTISDPARYIGDMIATILYAGNAEESQRAKTVAQTYFRDIMAPVVALPFQVRGA